MQNFKVIYSDKAVDQLQEIYNYIKLNFFDPQTARSQTDRIMLEIESLALFPKRHRVRGYDHKGKEIRFCPVDNYVILYSVNDDECTVNISSILYGRRNMNYFFSFD